MDKYITPKEFSKRSKIPLKLIRKDLKSGFIPCIMHGHKYYFTVEEAEAYYKYKREKSVKDPNKATDEYLERINTCMGVIANRVAERAKGL